MRECVVVRPATSIGMGSVLLYGESGRFRPPNLYRSTKPVPLSCGCPATEMPGEPGQPPGVRRRGGAAAAGPLATRCRPDLADLARARLPGIGPRRIRAEEPPHPMAARRRA